MPIFLLSNWKYLLAGGAIIALGAYHFWAMHDAYNKGYSSAMGEVAKVSLKYKTDSENKIAAIDKAHTQEMQDANKQMEDLRIAIANGSKRMSIRAVCPAATNNGASVDHAETRAELDPKTADDLVAIARDGDDAIRQLTAAQEVITVLMGTASGHAAPAAP